jgi:hypothetical protein
MKNARAMVDFGHPDAVLTKVGETPATRHSSEISTNAASSRRAVTQGEGNQWAFWPTRQRVANMRY